MPSATPKAARPRSVSRRRTPRVPAKLAEEKNGEKNTVVPPTAHTATSPSSAGSAPKPAPTPRTVSPGLRLAVPVGTILAVLVVALLLMACGGDSGRQAPVAPACGCASDAYHSLAGPRKGLVGALLRQREGVNGVQVQTRESAAQVKTWLEARAPCAQVVELRAPPASTQALRRALRQPFASASAKRRACVVWLVSVDAVSPVANALKELLEKNTLQGDTVVPPGSRGVLLLLSPKDREALKEVLPHRVVHMLSPLALPDGA